MRFPQLKEVDDVLGGQAAWDNVDTTEGLILIIKLLLLILYYAAIMPPINII